MQASAILQSRRILPTAALLLCLVFFGTARPVQAGDLPDQRLFDALVSSKSEMEARIVEAEIWESWIAAAPSVDLEAKVRSAMSKRRVADYEGALMELNSALETAPDYAEAWNQRAFIHYLQGKPDRSLEDIERVLELEPRHFGALSGKGRILMEQGRVRLGQQALREAVALHPFIPERFLLIREQEEKGIDL